MSEIQMIEMPAEKLPVLDEADVVVVGGGTSGFLAAVAAARTGAETVLIERLGYLGGCTTAPYNTSIGWFGDSEKKLIIRGLAMEFLKRMEADGQAFIIGENETANQIWPPYTKKIAFDMVEEAGVKLWLHSWAYDVVMDGDVLKGVVMQTKGGRGIVLGKTFVDTSADADIAAWCGAPNQVEDINNIQQVSCDHIACGVDAARVVEWALENEERLGLRIRGKEFKNKDGGAQPMFTIVIPGDATDLKSKENFHVGWMPTVKLCIYREAVRIQGNSDINPLDPKALTRAEVDGLRGAIDHLNFMKDNVPGFENAFIVAQSHLGVRESRQILGDYFITIDDAKNEAHFDDVVALNCRALDYHLKGTVFKISHLKRAHDIPLRALLPQGVENLVVGGRCISCDHLSQASIRGAATCMATGHAAGTSAAIAAMNGQYIRDVDVRLIQKTLIEQDVILSMIEGREPWLGDSVTLRQDNLLSMAGD